MINQQTNNMWSSLLAVANEYKEQGYRVVIQPTREDLPEFLAAFKPDIIAYGNDENVVVEVKTRHMLAESDYLPALADTINSIPGWRLDLVASNPPAALTVAQDVEELSRAEIQDLLATVHELSSMTQEEAATLLAWSATEAALRLVAKKKGVQLESDQPMFIIKKLFSLGILSREDYELFYEGMRLRNVIVHGYRPPKLNGNLAGKLTKTVEALLDIDATSPAA
jgi:uncharacterized protein YutE (UPF0331/DUF86 family)